MSIAQNHVKILQKIEDSGCPNVFAYLILLDAEMASNNEREQVEVLVRKFDAGIMAMRSQKWVHMEALACERAAFAMERRGVADIAATYIDIAMAASILVVGYGNIWSARAKYEYLRDKVTSHMYDHGGSKQQEWQGVISMGER
jgi:hypothetical protein